MGIEKDVIGGEWFSILVFSISIIFIVLLRNERVQLAFGREKVSRYWKIIYIFLVYTGFDFFQNFILNS